MVAALVGVAAFLIVAEPTRSYGSVQADRMAWFKEARFGMFIHWGIYAVPAGEWEGVKKYDEWFQLETKMPCAQYDQFAAQFNPTQFDAKAWAKLAKDAGMKYVVITAKHHDGFCMYDSKLTDFDIIDATPYKKDLMRELADAVRAEGLVFCFYYSVPDWHDGDFPAKYSMRGGFHGNPKSDPDSEKYVEYVKGQVRELLTNYGPIGILWFDGGGSFGKDDATRVKVMHAQEILDMIRELQPNCLVNNRLGLEADYGTPEQKIPGEKGAAPFEVCMTINDHGHWGYNKHDTKFKSKQALIRNLADIASKGGNYLLNVGPTAEGVIPPNDAERITAMGQWLKTNGESIYGTTASPFEITPPWGRITQKGKTLYLHVFDWPADGRLVAPLPTSKPTGAYLLSDASKTPLEVQLGEEEPVIVTLPAEAPDPDNSVIVLQCE